MVIFKRDKGPLGISNYFILLYIFITYIWDQFSYAEIPWSPVKIYCKCLLDDIYHFSIESSKNTVRKGDLL